MTPDEKKELVDYRFQRAEKTLAELDRAVNSKDWNLAMNRMYYACFYAATSLLASIEIITKTYNGVKQMFALHFVKKGLIDKEHNDFYSKIFSLRQSGDYEDFCDYEKEDVVELLEPANEFVSTIERILYKK